MSLEDAKEVSKLFVFKGDRHVGLLERTDTGAVFQYTESYLRDHTPDQRTKNQGVAFTLPPSLEPYRVEGVNLPPFFAGLLPEGARLKALIRSTKTSADDLFTLLLAAGDDTIGDVWVNTSLDYQPQPGSPTELSKVSFLELFEQAIDSKTLKEAATQLRVAGVQPKLSASLISFPLRLQGRHTQHILKLENREFPQLIENEHFFMHVAADLGLDVPQTKIVSDRENAKGLLVERFDREYNNEQYNQEHSNFRKLHLEDSCQFLARYPADKYRLRVRDIARAVAQYSSAPTVEISRLIRLFAFSYLIGNGDLHGKNISLLQDPLTGRITLSPHYDLLSTMPYGDLTLALPFEGRKSNVRAQQFLEFGAAFNVPPKVVRRVIEELCDKIPKPIKRLEEIGFPNKEQEKLQREMQKRREHLR